MEAPRKDGGPWQTASYLILAAVIIAPMWIFARELGPDEFLQSSVGLAAGAVVLTALRMLEKRFLR